MEFVLLMRNCEMRIKFKKKIIHFIQKRISKTERLIGHILKLKLTYLSRGALHLIIESIIYIENKNIKGDFIETGCALGGSSILIGKLKKHKRTFKIFDSFEMMPTPSSKDDVDVHERFEVISSGNSKGIGNNLYYGYEKDLLKKVKENFNYFKIDIDKNNIQFIKGYYEDTLKIDNPVAFAHIDCDWYDSVFVSLKRIVPFLSVGGIPIIDDYFRYSGCRIAIDEYFIDKKNQFKFIEKERLLIKRIK